MQIDKTKKKLSKTGEKTLESCHDEAMHTKHM